MDDKQFRQSFRSIQRLMDKMTPEERARTLRALNELENLSWGPTPANIAP